MKVVVDGLVFENTHQIGIWRMFYEVMNRLADRVDFTLWLRGPAKQPIPRGVKVVCDSGRSFASSRREPIAWLSGRWARRFPRVSWIKNADLFHSTFFTTCPVVGPVVVASVYDMIAELAYSNSGGGGLWWPGMLAKRETVEGARLCVGISRATAVDLTRVLPQAAGRVRVVQLAADHLPARRRAAAEARKPAALFVGHRDGYKNFVTVLEGMAESTWPSNIGLRVIGSPLEAHEWQLVGYYGLTERVVSVGRVTDEQLAMEYAAAACFVFPSRLEGFGLPILEAQLNGCPVVCSDTPVFREVAGEAAAYFDPRLGERLAEAVATVCEPGVRLRLVEAGYKNVSRFSWDRAAEEMLSVYEEAVALGRN